jgi:hypothetical protein
VPDQYSPQQEVDNMAKAVTIDRYPFINLNFGQLNFSILESVSLDYDIGWESVSVYGRQDAIQSYKTTGQTISLTVAQTFTSAQQFKNLLATLNKFSRPIYENDLISRSPLWSIKLLDGNGYIETPIVIAPNSVSVDYGDRLRKIAAVRGSAVDTTGAGDDIFGKIEKFPKRVSISIGGAVINTKRQYSRFDSGPAAPGPVADPTAPQSAANQVKITQRRGVTVLQPIRTEGSE